jgi:hypothetical protein
LTGFVWDSSTNQYIVNGNDTTYVDKITGTGFEPQTIFDLVQSILPDSFSFKITTTFTNNMTHINSASLIIDITCNTGYIISTIANTTIHWNGNDNLVTTSTQYLTNGSAITGFVLPIYTNV